MLSARSQWCGASARVVSIDDGKSDDRDEAHERDPQRLRRVHDEGEVLRRLDSHTKGSEGNDDRSMPRSHTRLDGHDDRHTTHGEGDAYHGEGKVARSLEGEERESRSSRSTRSR